MSESMIVEPDSLARLYRARAGTPELINVPPGRFLAIDGKGSPDDESFQDAVGALYAIAYTAKFTLKKAGGDVKVPPLEGLFLGVFDDAHAYHRQFDWTLMLRLPEPIDDALVERARSDAQRKRSLPAIDRVRIEWFAEGVCAQVMHIGPYSSEPVTVSLLHDFIRAQGLEPRGRHHEIYLRDPRRTKPERLETILRQPVD